MKGTTPPAAFLVAHPAHFFALGFGAGLVPFAPGTFGTLLAVPIALVLWEHTGDAGYVAATVALGIVAVWAADVTGRDLGVPDHGSIVCDEMVAFLAVLFFTGPRVDAMIVGFVLFRIFDIAKPPPIRALDARWKNGWGVLADDLLAAAYTLVVLAVLGWWWG